MSYSRLFIRILPKALKEKMKLVRRKLVPAISSLKYFHVDKPMLIDLELTNRCNLRCKMCWFWGESGVGNRYSKSELSTDDVCTLIDEVATYKPSIYIGGGEPFVRDDILKILEHIKNRSLAVWLTTNGTLIDNDKIEQIVELGIDCIAFSVDGEERLHDVVRGIGTFKKVTKSIKELSRHRERLDSEKPVILTNTVISNLISDNLREVLTAIRDATSDKVDNYIFQHLWFITKNELHEHQSVVERFLGVKAPNAVSHLISSSQVLDVSALVHEVSHLRRLPKVRFYPDLVPTELLKYYTEGRVCRRCVAPFFGVIIKPNGDVVFCPDEWISDYILGNVRKADFIDIWNGAEACKFREVLFMHGSFPGCKRCCWNYLF
jgi:radical SAM protein with 4Fe4S-binding SPASM domain